VKIKRTLANKIMTRAIRDHETCLLCILSGGAKLLCPDDCDDISPLLESHPEAVLVYNQNTNSLQLKDRIAWRDGQQSIEIFQDTEGVFGLRAWQLDGKLQTPVTLEYFDD
jgi:xanthine dehydrogenase iron-sulfur cluster and FAD-binding subunit A